MKQRAIDLVPDSIRVRSQAGVVAGRYVAALLVAIALMVVTVTHSRLVLDRAHKRLRVAEEQADLVLSAEAKADQLRIRLDDTRDQIRRYRLIATPLQVSRVIATVTNEMLPSATLDRIDFFGGSRRTNRSARSRGVSNEDGPAPPWSSSSERSSESAVNRRSSNPPKSTCSPACVPSATPCS